MTNTEILMASLGACGKLKFSPVQIQKLLFLIDRNIGQKIGGPLFKFEPYDYGPFDSSIYALLRALEGKGLVEASSSPGTWQYYALTSVGLTESENAISKLDQASLDYIKAASSFVRKLSFSVLVASIYKAYPEMQANSVFRVK